MVCSHPYPIVLIIPFWQCSLAWRHPNSHPVLNFRCVPHPTYSTMHCRRTARHLNRRFSRWICSTALISIDCQALSLSQMRRHLPIESHRSTDRDPPHVRTASIPHTDAALNSLLARHTNATHQTRLPGVKARDDRQILERLAHQVNQFHGQERTPLPREHHPMDTLESILYANAHAHDSRTGVPETRVSRRRRRLYDNH